MQWACYDRHLCSPPPTAVFVVADVVSCRLAIAVHCMADFVDTTTKVCTPGRAPTLLPARLDSTRPVFLFFRLPMYTLHPATSSLHPIDRVCRVVCGGRVVQVANAHRFRRHAEEALRLAPNDATVHHMLGRWCFEVAGACVHVCVCVAVAAVGCCTWVCVRGSMRCEATKRRMGCLPGEGGSTARRCLLVMVALIVRDVMFVVMVALIVLDVVFRLQASPRASVGSLAACMASCQVLTAPLSPLRASVCSRPLDVYCCVFVRTACCVVVSVVV